MNDIGRSVQIFVSFLSFTLFIFLIIISGISNSLPTKSEPEVSTPKVAVSGVTLPNLPASFKIPIETHPVDNHGVNNKSVINLQNIANRDGNISINISQPHKSIDLEIEKRLQNGTRVEVFVKYKDDRSVTLRNEETLQPYYSNTSVARSFFSSISDSEMIITQSRLSALSPSFIAYVTEDGFQRLMNDSRVTSIGIVRQLTSFLDESVPLINANDAWSFGYSGGNNVTVCILDSGINKNHAALQGQIIDEFCICNNPEGTEDEGLGESGGCCLDGSSAAAGNNSALDNSIVSHGTVVAGIIASQSSTYRGVAPNVSIISIKVSNSTGATKDSDISAGIDQCRQWKNKYNVSIISISQGTKNTVYTHSSCPNGTGIHIQDNIDTSYNAGLTILFASGNGFSTQGISYPACSANVIAVGSSKKTDVMDPETNRKPGLLDLVAPGYSIFSTNKAGSFSAAAGTSFATPHVSGAVALLLGKKRNAKPAEIETALKNSSIKIEGYPRLDVIAALNYLCDNDLDGYDNSSCSGGNDCNDGDSGIYPSASEPCDGKDNDCDSLIDEVTCEGTGANCNESGYGQCYESTYGSCKVRIAVNFYTAVNTINWGAVNDSHDPYVIGQYKVGWKGVIAEKVYYNVSDPDGQECYFFGCNGTQWAKENTNVTTNAPGIAKTQEILAFNYTTWPTIDACWAWFYNFTPNYGSTNKIFVLNCFNNSDCTSTKFCNKTGAWQNWDCVNKYSDGHACNESSMCSSGFCDNDSTGLTDDGWCFTPYSSYFDGQETSYCEYSALNGTGDCDEKQAGTDLNKCVQTSYLESECSSSCGYQDITSVFDCNETDCLCSQSLCDGLTSGSNITTCSGDYTYFADKCNSTAGGTDRNDNICRSSSFTSGCTANESCNGVVAGTNGCNSTCGYDPYLTVTNLTALNTTSSVKIFEFWINSRGYAGNFSWSLNTGDSVITNSMNVTLGASESIPVIVEYNYSGSSQYIVNASASYGAITNSSTLNLIYLNISNFTVLNYTGRNRTFGFEMKNQYSKNLTNVLWNMTLGNNKSINGTQSLTLIPNETALFIVEYNYSSAGTYVVNITGRNATLISARNISITVA